MRKGSPQRTECVAYAAIRGHRHETGHDQANRNRDRGQLQKHQRRQIGTTSLTAHKSDHDGHQATHGDEGKADLYKLAVLSNHSPILAARLEHRIDSNADVRLVQHGGIEVRLDVRVFDMSGKA